MVALPIIPTIYFIIAAAETCRQRDCRYDADWDADSLEHMNMIGGKRQAVLDARQGERTSAIRRISGRANHCIKHSLLSKDRVGPQQSQQDDKHQGQNRDRMHLRIPFKRISAVQPRTMKMKRNQRTKTANRSHAASQSARLSALRRRR